MLYIFWLLHQTTTIALPCLYRLLLYIFWLLHQTTTEAKQVTEPKSCISFDSYIKPQLHPLISTAKVVVYLLTPTSNHNCGRWCNLVGKLYIFWLLHQTTTWGYPSLQGRMLYIFWLLHQTTTLRISVKDEECCISFDSYIKPQLRNIISSFISVVYLLTPTSNHNSRIFYLERVGLYIFWLLHQTTTLSSADCWATCCISFDSYIKPQRGALRVAAIAVVYLLTPTSNHNL